MGFTPNDPWDVKYNKYINKEACREEEEGVGAYTGLGHLAKLNMYDTKIFIQYQKKPSHILLLSQEIIAI